MWCSAARGPGPCASAPPVHCPDSDPGARRAHAGMWNWSSLRTPGTCRKPGRVACGRCSGCRARTPRRPPPTPGDGAGAGRRSGVADVLVDVLADLVDLAVLFGRDDLLDGVGRTVEDLVADSSAFSLLSASSILSRFSSRSSCPVDDVVTPPMCISLVTCAGWMPTGEVHCGAAPREGKTLPSPPIASPHYAKPARKRVARGIDCDRGVARGRGMRADRAVRAGRGSCTVYETVRVSLLTGRDHAISPVLPLSLPLRESEGMSPRRDPSP